MKNKFINISLLIVGLLVVLAIFYNASTNRCQPVIKDNLIFTFDKLTGDYYYYNGYKINPIEEYRQSLSK